MQLRESSPLKSPVPADRSAGGAKTIAVLPFVNISADPENEYFSDGIAEELLNVLVKVQGLEVSSRTSSFAFKNQEVSIPEIAAQVSDPARKAEALNLIRADVDQYPDLATMWAYRDLGEVELSLDNLEKAMVDNPTWLSFLWDQGSGEIRRHPRFKPLVTSLGFPGYWRQRGWPEYCRAVGENDFECE